MNMAGTNPKMPYHVPVCWVRDYGKGRMFYTNLGHNESTWKDERYRSHLLAGIQWILKMEDAPAKPNPDVQAVENAKGFCVAAGPMVDREWTDLLGKASKKIKGNTAFAEKLNSQIAEFRRMPTGDPKKETPEQIEQLKAKRVAFAKQIAATIEQ